MWSRRFPSKPTRLLQSDARAFTLVELMVSIAIIAILLTIASFSLRSARASGSIAQAKNAVVTYASIARNYAMANHVETMFVVNPYNGRFEIWYLNPPIQGGPWDPNSSGTTFPNTDGYAFAPVLDSAAALPLDSDNRPLVVVHPIDYADVDSTNTPLRPQANDEASIDNLTWAAMCFDEDGRMVVRTRRFATRSFFMRTGAARPGVANRLRDGTPNLAILTNTTQPMIDVNDTPVTSTRGFVISNRRAMESVVSNNPSPVNLVSMWLMLTQPGRRYSDFAETVTLDRFSGRELAGDS